MVSRGEPIGKTQTFKAAEVTVLEVKDKIQAHSDFGSDERWFGALAKICFTSELGPDGSYLTWSPWSVIGSDGGTYPASTSNWEDFPTPKYPSAGEVFKAGECAQGWILFAVKNGVAPAVVRYSNQSGNVARWNV